MQFDDDDQALLMLLAGELPDAAAKAMAQRLQEDWALRQRYAALAETLELLNRSVAADDVAQPLASTAAGAARQIGRVMRQWQADQFAVVRRPMAVRRSVPIWAYPLAAAAMIVVGFLCWWSYWPGGIGGKTVAVVPMMVPPNPNPGGYAGTFGQAVPVASADDAAALSKLDPSERTLAQVFVGSFELVPERSRRFYNAQTISDAERDAASLDVLSNSINDEAEPQ
jgi:anti-sigma factor RsiW